MRADTEFTFVKVDSYLTAITEIDNDKKFSDQFEWVVNELTIEKIMNEYGQSADYMTTAEIQAHSGFKDRLAKLLIQSINLKVEKDVPESKPVDLDIEAIKQEYKKKSSFLNRLLNR